MQQHCYTFGMDRSFAGLGTKLRFLLEQLDGDLARFEDEIGLAPYRPRYSPFVRALVEIGPVSIRDLAKAVGVTHSAASQTIAQMVRDGLVELRRGDDGRQRIVHLTDRTHDLLPLIDREWAIDEDAIRALDAELPHPLGDVVDAALAALERRPFLDRLRDVAV